MSDQVPRVSTGHVSLSAMLRVGFLISRRERLFLAAVCSSSILQLSNTPWLKLLSSTSVDFARFRDDTDLSCPIAIGGSYIDLHRPLISPVITETTVTPETALIELGILLIELALSEAFEVVANRKTAEEIEAGREDGIAGQTTRRGLGLSLIKILEHETGVTFSDAVTRCLNCSFGQTTVPSWDDEGFCREYFTGVVLPMVEGYQQFSSAL